MEDQFKAYEKQLQKKHRFGWPPNYQEHARTRLHKKAFLSIVIEACKKLDWDVVYTDEKSVEAKRKGAWNKWTEKITVTHTYGQAHVKSVSLGNGWDNGRNYKNVQLFLHVFETTEKTYDQEALEALAKAIERQENWDDYEVPATLPPPKKRIKPQLMIPVIGGLAMALLLGFSLAFLTVKFTYIIGIYEVIVALIVGFFFKYLIRLGNYTNFDVLPYVIGGVVFLIYLSNQYFLYELIWTSRSLEPIGFLEFLQLRLKQGLTIKSIHTGPIGLVVSWVFQLVFTYLISYLRVIAALTVYLIDRVPTEVSEFAMYHFIKGKTRDQVRSALSNMGWTSEQCQNEAFDAIAGMQSAREFHRAE